ncbi:GGDEF domain-containing protein [Roseospira visakhapatnamensis]|uniref:Diguanylate cyclase (GGDEF)-like protein n=1 Tax=Roseospira visakhapatnamensis TaxID=390880 RepID=A0A7W6RGN0_9PROT|nr:GGDEF domain-containing protein [Roseospira visakhapatnamensis]MBB4267990.1 diguanylate cyclase (GGDEF)-like protein [Roseospira visakhapatnamensis]
MARSMGWSEIIPRLHMVLEPIVGVHSGRTLGVEAVIGNATDLGFASAHDLLDCAAAGDPADPPRRDSRLAEVEARAHAAAVAVFARMPDRANVKLFLNLDARLLGQAEAIVEALRPVLAAHGVPANAVVPEISERLAFRMAETLQDATGAARGRVERAVSVLRGLSGRLALGNFGAGYASLPLLRVVRPDFVTLDRFFVQDVAGDRDRKLMLNALANMTHLMGIQMVAGGVATVEDYQVMRHAGCDYVQGPLIGGRVADPAQVPMDQEAVRALNHADQRRLNSDAALIAAKTQRVDPILMGTSMAAVFERFRHEKDQNFFPVVDAVGEPVGIIRELDLKEYTYSLYGKELLSNRALGRTLDAFVAICPVADVNTKAEKVLEVFSGSDGAECILIVSERKYIGFMSAQSLLRVINEKNLALARDQNPLSKLPGNTMINEYIAECLQDVNSKYIMVYLDFDNFKPFNDKYGYRQGDRAITLFAELLRKQLPRGDVFVGHVGGDDFFVGLRAFRYDQAVDLITSMVRTFERDVESFYDEESRRRGYIVARDREGVERKLPLLSASAAVVQLSRGHAVRTADEIAGVIAGLKKAAKAAPDKIASACYTDGETLASG